MATTLHLVFSVAGAHRCQQAGIETDVILIGDGVYAIAIAPFTGAVRALETDLAERGFEPSHADTITMDEFVALTVDSERTVSWR